MFGRLIPLLFAAPSSLSPASQLVNEVKTLYRDLDAANLSRQYTDTIKFSFVSPPSETHTNSWRCESQKQKFSMDHDDVFGQIASTHGSSKPLALYLPGLDGVGISATAQFDDLAETFELWRMSVSSNDRTSFSGLTETVSSFINDAAVKLDREVVLIGESFGGLLAPAVAMRTRAQHSRRGEETAGPIKGMVLVNPATSFDETQWSTVAPLLAQLKHLKDENEAETVRRPFNLPSPYSVVGGLALATTVPDTNQLRRIVSMMMMTDVPVTNPDELTDVIESMVAGFGILDDSLPADVIEHRVGQWLPVGTAVVKPRLSALDVPTVVVAGQDDNMLPTKKEAERLVKVMPNCVKMDVRGSGHFVLDERVNLTKAIIESHIDPLNKKLEPPYDPITDWSLPPDDVVKDTLENRVKPLRNLVSPVFFSTGPDGSRRMGLSHLPGENEGPLLFVANHQFGGIDLGLIIAELIESRGIRARGLAHPVIFAAGSGESPFAGGGGPAPEQQTPGGGDPNKDGLFQQFGAVKVTPRNYYRLMQTGQSALLFPGGVREVFHGKDEAYTLFWPEKVDFVRIASKFNATVIPLSAIGAADSVNILIDAPDMLKLPFIGERAANNSANVVSARFDADDTAELFQPPFALPKPLPARHYFMFGKAMKTDNIDHTDKDACQQFYLDIQAEMQRGFDDVLRARDKDPFAGTARRVAYEQVTGKTAPTFPLSELKK